MTKSFDAFRTISEVAEDLGLPQHVLRFWETRFPQIKPMKRAGGRRFYRPADILLLTTIKQLLYGEGYTIRGVQRLLKEQGARAVRDGLRPAEGDETDEEAPAAWSDDGDEDTADGPGAPPIETTPPPARSEPFGAEDPVLADDDAPETRVDREHLDAVLTLVTECEAILRAARRPRFEAHAWSGADAAQVRPALGLHDAKASL